MSFRLRLRVPLALVLTCGCAKSVPPPRAPEPVPQPAPEPAPPPPRHVEHEDGITVTGVLGSLSEDEIAQAFRPRWAEVAKCTQHVQARLHYLNGSVELKFRVLKTGASSRVYIERSSLGNYEAERCVLEIARGIVFPSPHGGDEAEFTFPVEVRPRSSSPWVVAWEEARLGPNLEKNRKDVGICRGDAPPPIVHHKHHKGPVLKITPVKNLPSSLALTLYITPGGKVASAGLAAAGGPIDDTFAACLIDKARAWKLDDPRGQIAKTTIGLPL